MTNIPAVQPPDDDEDLWERIRERGEIVARHEWNSGNPGAGAGADYVYLYEGAFYAQDDLGLHGPFKTLGEASEAILMVETEATERIWIDPRFG